MEAYTIVSETHNTNVKYNISRRSLCFKLNDVPNSVNSPESWLKNGLRSIVHRIFVEVDQDDKVGFCFSSDGWSRGNAYLAFRPASQLVFDDIWSLLGKVYQSNASNFDGDSFTVTMTQLKPIRGCGRVSGSYTTYEEECSKRKGIVVIKNKDNLCLPRALVVAIAYLNKDPNLYEVRQNVRKRQDIEAQKLMAQANISIPVAGAGIDELQQFQRHLSGFKITVYKYSTKGREVLYQGIEAAKKINLLHHNNHFNVITSLTSAFGCGYFCEECCTPYNTPGEHRCIGSCFACNHKPACAKTSQEVTCADCNRSFRGMECYNRHKVTKGKQARCDKVKKCSECLRTYSAARPHKCDEVYCQVCKRYQQVGHHCYIQPDTKAPPKDDGLLYVFFDLETRQDGLDFDGINTIHTPNLCVFIPKCHGCFNDLTHQAGKCKCVGGVKILQQSPIEEFIDYILSVRKQWNKVVVLAHNAQAFDSIFCLKHLIEKTDLKIELVMRGTKVTFMGVENVKFIDSLNYFPMPLSALPKAFDLGPEIRKGYFPHYFNTLANASYIGPLPHTKYYDPDAMKEEQRAAFFKWYEEHKTDVFDLQKELVSYCVSDVDILTKACLKFRQMMLTECGVEPFAEAVTIASACNLVFRRNYLKPNTIGLIPKRGYRNIDTQSKIATQWLLWEERQRGINIVHSAKQREAVIDGARVDGYCEDTRQVFEYNGCFYHGCGICFPESRNTPSKDDPSDTLENRLTRTKAKADRLRQRGYEVIEMWGCQFKKIMAGNPEIARYTENHPLTSKAPLDARDAFFGGRTGNCCSLYHCKQGEKARYVDVCSLYPFICKQGRFPVGHPKVYVGDECSTLNLAVTDGLIKCKILPPTDLYHPVLPMKANNKLMFGLCRTCMVQLNQTDCTHSEEERALLGTWVIAEVNKAIEKGYKVQTIHEIWKYEVVQYDKINNVEGLFTGMMNKFIKIKQQASGWPEDCPSEAERLRYIEDFFNREDVRLEYNEILKNPGLRSMAKLMLNSFWGKFGQRENQPKTSIVRTEREYASMIHNPSLEIKDIVEVNDEILVINYEHLDETYEPLSMVSVSVAAFVTAQARLKLYSYLEDLGDRVLYYDTDSVIYVSREGEWDVPTGSFLGDMTNELEDFGPGSYITAFASGGPKNYAYIVFSPKFHTYYTVCKVKGIRLNWNATQHIHFSTLSSMALGEQGPINITSKSIRRDKHYQVVNRTETKVYRPCNEKRKFDETFGSVPYGYKKIRPVVSPPPSVFTMGIMDFPTPSSTVHYRPEPSSSIMPIP